MRYFHPLFAVFVLSLAAATSAATPSEPMVAAPAIAPAIAIAPAPAMLAAPAATAAPVAAPVAEKLVVFNRPVFTARGPLLGVGAADRVKRAEARVRDQLALNGPHTVTIQAESIGYLVQMDGSTSFYVAAVDLDPAREDNLQVIAQQAAAALTLAIQESQESRNLETMLWALGKAMLGAAIYGALVWAVGRGRRTVAQRLVALTAVHTQKLQVGGLALLQRERVSQIVRALLQIVYQVLVLLITFEWLSFTLRAFPFTRAWGESLNRFLLDLATPLFKGAIAAVPELLTALFIFYLAWLVTRALDRFFEQVQQGKVRLSWLDADVALPTRRIAKSVVWLFALAMAYPYLPGSGTEAFKGLSVLVGLMLSMGASSLVGQAASGLILTYGRVFRKGEFVRAAEQEGTVTEMGIFTTRIRTAMGEDLTISNASILGSTTRNFSRAVQGQGFVIDTVVTIGYDTSWRQVHAMLIEAARRTPCLLSDPAPQVYQTELSDWYPVYRLVCHAVPGQGESRPALRSMLHAHIQDVFNEHGVQIMSPRYIDDPRAPKVVPPDQWYVPPAVPPGRG